MQQRFHCNWQLHQPIGHPIELEPNYKLPYGRIYNLSEVKLKTLKAYMEANLANGFIPRLSPAAARIMFAKKMHGELQLCADYWALNQAVVKNWYLIPLISEMLDSSFGMPIT